VGTLYVSGEGAAMRLAEAITALRQEPAPGANSSKEG
jgi:hypothetical protein